LNQENGKDHDGGDEHNGINRRLLLDRLEPDRMVDENVIAETRCTSTHRHRMRATTAKTEKRYLSANDHDKIQGDLPGQQAFESRETHMRASDF
jgi:hypothetical protein